jgi:hypothetical protein
LKLSRCVKQWCELAITTPITDRRPGGDDYLRRLLNPNPPKISTSTTMISIISQIFM